MQSEIFNASMAISFKGILILEYNLKYLFIVIVIILAVFQFLKTIYLLHNIRRTSSISLPNCIKLV